MSVVRKQKEKNSMKRIYFVRHGETVANVESKVQGLEDPLTPEGELQALRVAERFLSLPIDLCLSSDAVRAKQTAQHIGDSLKLPFIYSSLFREIRRPTSLVGLSRDTEPYQSFRVAERAHFGEDWHMEDEESYPDRVRRAKEALALIDAQEGSDILVVTHGHFLRFLISTILLGNSMSPEVWLNMETSFWTSNTGITVCTRGEKRWRLLTWNDHAHFGDNVFQESS